MKQTEALKEEERGIGFVGGRVCFWEQNFRLGSNIPSSFSCRLLSKETTKVEVCVCVFFGLTKVEVLNVLPRDS